MIFVPSEFITLFIQVQDFYYTKIINEYANRITCLEQGMERFKEQISLMQHQLFGKKSEKNTSREQESTVDPNTSTTDPHAAENTRIIVARHTRKKGVKSKGRLVDTSALSRHQFYHDLAEGDKQCRVCQEALVKAGQDVSEQLEIVPARLYVAEHIRYKYICRKCECWVMSPKPPAPIPKALAGGSLITDIVVNKYQYHLPLYRQSKIFLNEGAVIPDNTLAHWITQTGEGLMPVLEAAWKVLLSTRYLQVDETPVKMLHPDQTGYVWVYLAPRVGKGLIIFDFHLTRSGSIPEERLSTFKGLLQTDGYGGYKTLRQREHVTGCGCLTHARRKFDEVLKISKNKKGLAAEVLERLKPVYALEDRMRTMQVNDHTRKRLRQKYAWPLLKALHSWIKKNKSSVPGRSKLSTAIQYFLNQWPYIIRYLRHGSVEIDTNWVENDIRPLALGRKNWLFVGHTDSAKIHGLWYSLIISAVKNDINPRTYVHYLLTKIHDIRTKVIDPATLLPHNIDRAELKIFAEKQLLLAKEVLNSS